MSEDFELLSAWRSGDSQAGDELVRRHFQTVHRFFRNKVETEVDDLVQRTFLGCLEAIARFREHAAFKTFLLSIARNQLFLHYRGAAVAKRRPVEDLSVHDLGIGGSPSAVLAGREEQRLLLEGLRRLPLDQQIAIELYYWEGLGVAGVASVLEIPPGTVKSRLSRARENLRDAIEALEADDEVRTRTANDLEGWARSLRQRALGEEE